MISQGKNQDFFLDLTIIHVREPSILLTFSTILTVCRLTSFVHPLLRFSDDRILQGGGLWDNHSICGLNLIYSLEDHRQDVCHILMYITDFYPAIIVNAHS